MKFVACRLYTADGKHEVAAVVIPRDEKLGNIDRPAAELVIHDGKCFQVEDIFTNTVPPFRYRQIPAYNTDSGLVL